MADMTKHRAESDTFSVDFENLLGSGEALTASTEVVKVTEYDGENETWKDVSSEFGSPSGSVSGTEVQFTLGKGGTDEQDGGSYVVRVECDTDQGNTLAATATLFVDETGDPDAP